MAQSNRVRLCDVDGKMANLALMKLSSYHKSIGDDVDWFDPLFHKGGDVVYASKVFTFTEDNYWLPHDANIGGSGYNMESLDDTVEHLMPDYSLYGIDYSMGFLTRGCPRKCKWCVVPSKEGGIIANADCEEFLAHDKCVLLDNNVLAHEHGIRQIEKLSKLKVKIDFNQGLDARLIDKAVANVLGRCRWLKPIRLACDSDYMIPHIDKAVKLLRESGATPRAYFCYVLVNDIESALRRVEFLRSICVDPFAQPYRDFNNNTEPTQEQKDFARWVNHKAIFKTTKWSDYK